MTPEQRLEHLARTVGPDVLGYLARRVDPVEDAADVYSLVLTTTWRRLRIVPTDDREAFAWMLGVARKCLANHRRGLGRRHALADRLRQELPLACGEAGADADRVQQALQGLGETDRELVTLVYWEGLTAAEAGTVVGISHAAARKRLERARTALRQQLTADGPQPPAWAV